VAKIPDVLDPDVVSVAHLTLRGVDVDMAEPLLSGERG
jgi:hypothetical protein